MNKIYYSNSKIVKCIELHYDLTHLHIYLARYWYFIPLYYNDIWFSS